MLRKMAARFSRLVELDLSFYPSVTDSDLKVIADGFGCLHVLGLQHCRGWARVDLGRFKKLVFSI